MALYADSAYQQTAEFNAETMVYTLTRRYTVTGAASIEEVIAQFPHGEVGDGITYTIPWLTTVTHKVFDLYDHEDDTTGPGDLEQDVLCWLTGRRVERTTNKDGVYIYVATYEGRVTGRLSYSLRTQMASEILLRNLAVNPATDKHDQIGQGTEIGVTRDIPMMVYQIVTAINMTDIPMDAGYALLGAGSVNEEGWLPPWYDGILGPVIPDPDGVGTYVYLGIGDMQVDRRTRTVVVTHEFLQLTSRTRQHIYEWFGWKEPLDTEGRVVRVYDDPPAKESKILLIAGTDAWHETATILPTFTEMFGSGTIQVRF